MFFSLTAYPRRLHTVPVLYSRALFVCSKGGSLRLPKLPVHPSPSTSVLAVTSLFAKSMSLFLLCKFIWIISLDSTYKWCYVILVFVWFTSLSIIISRSIPVAAEALFHSFLTAEWYFVVYTCHSCFIHFSARGHLGCSRVLAVVNSTAVNTGVHVSFQSHGFLQVYVQ